MGTAIAVAVFSIGTASAAPILSGDGEQWSSTLAAVCAQVGQLAPCGGITTFVTEHPAWMDDALTDAHWVSYADTGYNDGVLAPRAGSAANPTGQTAIMSITELFVGQAGANFSVRFWADDTLGVFFNGIQMKAPVFGQDTCANAPVGCEPLEFWDLNGVTTGGVDVLTLVAYQVGTGTTTAANPFGVLYTGSYTPASVPEPMTLSLVASGLLVAALRRRVRRT
jgi:hypothetical protein